MGDRRLVLITGHRRENFGQGFADICQAIAQLSDRFPGVEFVYPVHLNPNVQAPVRQVLSGRDNVHLIEPVSYPEFVWLMDRATLILTDSGGVQEEAPSLGKPVLVMRDTTERPEAVEAGAAELVGTSAQTIIDRCMQVHGAGGLTEDYCMAEAFNYARWCRQADGPDQVHQMALGKQVIKRFGEG